MTGARFACRPATARAAITRTLRGPASTATPTLAAAPGRPRLGDFSHTVHAGEMELECSSCHGRPPALRLPADRQACAECH